MEFGFLVNYLDSVGLESREKIVRWLHERATWDNKEVLCLDYNRGVDIVSNWSPGTS